MSVSAGADGASHTSGVRNATGVSHTLGAASPLGALRAAITLRRGQFTLDVDIEASPGEVVAVLGPNGAGKSTLLAVLAGLLRPDSGTVHLAERLLTGPDRFVAPAERRVGLMGQDPLLFPHLTAIENIAFGPRSQRMSRLHARATARDWLDRLGLTEFGGRRPAQLSGGQRQRVALARALAADPALLLLDEPLGAVDAQTAPEIRQLLRTHIRAAGTPTILVTHDVLDAATLADRVIVLQDGVIVDSGRTAWVLAMPRSTFSAALAGLNLVTGMTLSSAEPGSPITLAGPATGITGIAAESLSRNDMATALFAPSAVAVYLGHTGGGSPRNTWPATVLTLEPGPSAVRVRAAVDAGVSRVSGVSGVSGVPAPDGARPEDSVIPGSSNPASSNPGIGGESTATIAADLTPAAIAELRLEPGARVYLSVKATEVRIHAR